jgi:hypothetical protein
VLGLKDPDDGVWVCVPDCDAPLFGSSRCGCADGACDCVAAGACGCDCAAGCFWSCIPCANDAPGKLRNAALHNSSGVILHNACFCLIMFASVFCFRSSRTDIF